MHKQITAAFRTQNSHTFSADFGLLVGLRTSRNRNINFLTKYSRNLNISTQSRCCHRNRHPNIKVSPVTNKELVFFNGNKDIKVAVVTASNSALSFIGNTHTSIIFNTCRNFYFKRFFMVNKTFTIAFFAFVFNNMTFTMAVRTSCLHDHKAVLNANFASSAAVLTNRSFFAVGSTVSVTFFTNGGSRNFNFLFHAVKSLLKRNFEIIANICPILRLRTRPITSAAHKIRKNI